jgi:hypothetical protein
VKENPMSARKLSVVAFAVLICLVLAGAVAAEGPKNIAEYRGVAANTSAFGMQGIVPITFEFYYWTSQDTMNQLGAALAKGGQDALLAELQKIDNPAGYMRTPESLAIKLRTATRTVMPDGSINIGILTDRIQSAVAKMGGAQTADYPLEMIQLVIPASGKDGKGKILRQAAMAVNPKTGQIEVAQWSNEPTIVNEIRAEKVD